MCILFKFSTFKIKPPLFSQLSTSITNLRAEIPKKYSHVSARIKWLCMLKSLKQIKQLAEVPRNSLYKINIATG